MQPLPMYQPEPEEPPPPRWVAYAELGRATAALVAFGLAFAGGLLAGARFEHLIVLLPAALAAAALTASAGAFNDLYDLPRDRTAVPARPLPSERLSPASARNLGWGFLAAALLFAALAGALPLLLVITAAILSAASDLGGRRIPLLNLLLPAALFSFPFWIGIAAMPGHTFAHPLPLATLLIYALGVRTLRAAAGGFVPLRGALLAALLFVLSTLALLFYQASGPAFTDALTHWPFVLGFLVALSPVFYCCLLPPTPYRLRAAAQLGALASLWLAAALIAGTAGLYAGLTIALFYFPALQIAQQIPVP